MPPGPSQPKIRKGYEPRVLTEPKIDEKYANDPMMNPLKTQKPKPQDLVT